MNYWLVKSEPGEFSYQDLVAEGKTMWDGVRNYAARNHMRSMKKGDLVLFYHSVDQKEIVGISEVSKENYPDPTATKGDWSVVELKPFKALTKPVHLHTVKNTEQLKDIPLVKIGRLSVMPLEKKAFDLILAIGETSI